MRSKVEDRVGDELARAVEGCLPAAHGFDELGAAVGAEEVLLFLRDGADFAAPAGVDGRELGGYDVWGWCRGVGWRLGGEEARDEDFL